MMVAFCVCANENNPSGDSLGQHDHGIEWIAVRFWNGEHDISILSLDVNRLTVVQKMGALYAGGNVLQHNTVTDVFQDMHIMRIALARADTDICRCDSPGPCAIHR